MTYQPHRQSEFSAEYLERARQEVGGFVADLSAPTVTPPAAHDDPVDLANALCVMAFFLGMEHERHFDTHVAGWSVLAEATRTDADALRRRDRPRWDAWP